MNKKYFTIIPLIMLVMGCAGGAKPAGSSGGMDLDVTIKEAAARMGDKLPGGTKIALVSVASSSAQLSEYVISRLEAALVDGNKLVVVDRANLDKVREEQGFQLSGEVDDDSAKSIGKLLGAGAIVTGAFANLGDVYSLTLKAINIETATVAVSYPADIAKSTRIETLLASGGGAGTGTRTAQTGGKAAPEPAAYKIGDEGPAGGIVFYDKGNSSGGWRYLEAAPASTEGNLNWLVNYNGIDVGVKKTDVGTGKENTRVLGGSLSKGVPEAALHCIELDFGGFQDWFLPSKDELNLMYIYLQRKGLGGFSSDRYWSSSQSPSYSGAAYNQNFSDGRQDTNILSTECSVRAIRQF